MSEMTPRTESTSPHRPDDVSRRRGNVVSMSGRSSHAGPAQEEGGLERLTLDRLFGLARGPHALTPDLQARYEAHNDVVDSYYGGCMKVAVALVRDEERDRIDVACPANVHLQQNAEELLFRSCALYHEVDLSFEKGRDRKLALQMIYGVVAGLFKDLDRTAATCGDTGDVAVDCKEIAYLEKAYERAAEYFARATQRRGQMRYLAGMVAGFLVVGLVGFLLSIGLALLPTVKDQSATFLASLVAGAGGALVSVLFGMTSGKLRLHTLFASHESGLGPLVAAGALRPLLGALSGVVVYVFLGAGILPVKVPGGAAETHFYIAVAIVAGFSERWARGVIEGTEQRMSLANDGKQTAKPDLSAGPGSI